MKYYKNLSSDGMYIESVSTESGSIQIPESEYAMIVSVILSHEEADGFYYKLRADLTWEEAPDESAEEPEPLSLEEALEALADAEYKLCMYELGLEDFINDL